MTAFDWSDFLTLAERLANETSDEAAQRTAISRAYYAAYHAAAIFVRVEGLLPTGQTHQAVWGVLAADPAIDRSDLGLRGNRLKRARLEADYKLPFPGDLGKRVQDVVTEARAVVEALNRLA